MREKVVGAFPNMHPVVTTVYYAAVIGITMFSSSPLILAISLVSGIIYLGILKNFEGIRATLALAFIVMAVMAVINGIFVNKGQTCFWLGSKRISLEAVIYGVVMGLMLAAVIICFASFNEIMHSEKIIYIFGRVIPSLGVVISMILRYIPLMRRRWQEISEAQAALGNPDGNGSKWYGKIRLFLKKASILISWSLESSIETSDSMVARGYGLRGRTSYHLFRFVAKDLALLIVILTLATLTIMGMCLGAGRFYFYPEIRAIYPDTAISLKIMTYFAFAMLALLPSIIDVVSCRRRAIEWEK